MKVTRIASIDRNSKRDIWLHKNGYRNANSVVQYDYQQTMTYFCHSPSFPIFPHLSLSFP
ncbi:hypothetical protein PHAMO_40027 [Magnetospirillum molischianum DSM 120]|uniref:Uncharacterized protein n=1 Tax=Magnetospirillum molischianum DSM 120 TaxID=1150626 RepID=H8FVS8_MAGML|nr:hypothetical protein PHAMO_40027 [Magnetospirillum molischianum DSM 120]